MRSVSFYRLRCLVNSKPDSKSARGFANWFRIPAPQPRLPTEIDDVGEIPEPTRVSGIFYCKNYNENKKMTFGEKVGLQGFEPLQTLLKGGICEN